MDSSVDAPMPAAEPSISTTEPTGPEPEPIQPTQKQMDRLAWRKNAPSIYNTLITLLEPEKSLTVQWLPEIKDRSQELILGTRHLGKSPEYLRIGRLTMPNPELKNLNTYDSETGSFSSFQAGAQIDLSVAQRIDHSGEINKARYMPQNPNLIATISSTGQVAVFDKTKYPRNPIGNYIPSISLAAHTQDGFGLCWAPQMEGYLVTAANDSKVCIWDLKSTFSSQNNSVTPIHTLTFHTDAVNDVKWHNHNSQLIASCSDDKKILITDWRSPKVAQKVLEDQDVAYSVAFNPSNEYLLAVGFGNGTISLVDIRNGATSHQLQSSNPHTGTVTVLEWNPRYSAILASGSADSTVNLWDTSKIATGEEHRFHHVGHTQQVTDIGWNPGYDLVLASIAEDKSLDIWEPVWV